VVAASIGAVGEFVTGTSASGSTHSFGKPSGTVVGSMLVAIYTVEHNGSGTQLSPPSGWAAPPGAPAFQAVSSGTALYVWWKYATSGDVAASSFAMPVQSGRWVRGAVLRLVDHDTSANPWDAGNSAVAANSTNAPSTSITTTGPDRLLLWGASSYNLSAWSTMPSEFTELSAYADASSATTTAAQRTLASAGTVTTGSIATGASAGKATWLGAVKPAAPATETRRLYLTYEDADVAPSDDPLAMWTTAPTASTSTPRLLGNAPAGPAAYVGTEETAGSGDVVALIGRWVTGAASADGTLPANVPWELTMARSESDADAQMFWALGAWVMRPDGTRRATLFGTTEGPEWPVGGPAAPLESVADFHAFQNVNEVDVAVLEGDRIVLEVGFYAENTTSSPRSGIVVYGGEGTDELTEGDTGSALTSRPAFIDVPVSPGLGFDEPAGPPLVAPGTAFDLSRWHLTTPAEDPDDGDAEQIDQPELDSYASEFFHLDEDGRMVFVAPVEGATTSGESGATRSEKRERESDYSLSGWDPATTGRRQLTVVCRVDGTSIDGPVAGTEGRRQEVIFFQIHGTSGTPPIYLTAEWTSSGNPIGTPRVRMFVSGSGLSNANLVSPITPDTDIAVRCRVEDATLKLWCVLGTEEDLPPITDTPTFQTPVSAFTDKTNWYYKHGAYNKTKIGVGATGEAIVRTSFEELLQPGDPEPGGGSTQGALGATLALPSAALTGAVRAGGQLVAGTPRPAAAIAGAVADIGPLSAIAPAPTSVLTGGVLLTGSAATTLPMAASELVGTVTDAGSIAATAILPGAQIAATATVRGTVSADGLAPRAALGGTVAAGGALSGGLPAPVAELGGTVAADGALGAGLPAPVAELSGTVTADGALGADLPAPLAVLGGDSTATGPLAAAPPAPVGELAGTVTADGALDGQLPAPAGDLAGTVTADGALGAALPVPLAVLGGDSAAAGPLDAALPLPTAAVTATVVLVGELATSIALPTAQLVAAGQVEGQLAATAPMPRSALRVRPPVARVTEVFGLAAGAPTARTGLVSGSLTPETGLYAGAPARP